jgi:hypothetical protein
MLSDDHALPQPAAPGEGGGPHPDDGGPDDGCPNALLKAFEGANAARLAALVHLHREFLRGERASARELRAMVKISLGDLPVAALGVPQ